MFGELRQEMSQLHQDVTHSYQELRGDLRELILRVEILEQSQRSQDLFHTDITELRSDFDRMRGATDRFTETQSETFSSVQKRLQRIELGVGAILIGCTGSSDPFGGASTSQPSSRPPPQTTSRPPPHATPRPASTRPPFFSTMHSGTGFPEPSTRVGVSSRTRSSRGQAPIRCSRIHAPQTVDVPDSNSDSSGHGVD